jgi:hypothetical protein
VSFFPFPPQYFGTPSLDFGQMGPGGAEKGIDFAMPVGQPIFAPGAGLLLEEDLGKGGWGKRDLLQLDSGQIFGVGHLTDFAGITSGSRVVAGQVIGHSGGAVGDPSSGVSTGPHIEVQLMDPARNFLDPKGFLASLGGGGAPPIQQVSTGVPPIDGAIGLAEALVGLPGAITGIPGSIFAGIGTFLTAATNNVGVFFQKQFVALAVAAVVLLVLFA